MDTKPIRTSRRFRTGTVLARGVAVLLAVGVSSGVARAQTAKSFLDYIKPAPIVCSPLSAATWGATGVLPQRLPRHIDLHQRRKASAD